MNTIAWTPLLEPDLVRLVAIHASSTLEIDRDVYLGNLASRIQRMVNSFQDPQEAVDEFVETMFQEGLVSETVHCPADEAGTNLIISNSRVWDVLANLMVFKSMPAKPPLVTNLMAHQALKWDLEDDDPVGHLKSWAGGLARFA